MWSSFYIIYFDLCFFLIKHVILVAFLRLKLVAPSRLQYKQLCRYLIIVYHVLVHNSRNRHFNRLRCKQTSTTLPYPHILLFSSFYTNVFTSCSSARDGVIGNCLDGDTFALNKSHVYCSVEASSMSRVWESSGEQSHSSVSLASSVSTPPDCLYGELAHFRRRNIILQRNFRLMSSVSPECQTCTEQECSYLTNTNICVTKLRIYTWWYITFWLFYDILFLSL